MSETDSHTYNPVNLLQVVIKPIESQGVVSFHSPVKHNFLICTGNFQRQLTDVHVTIYCDCLLYAITKIWVNM